MKCRLITQLPITDITELMNQYFGYIMDHGFGWSNYRNPRNITKGGDGWWSVTLDFRFRKEPERTVEIHVSEENLQKFIEIRERMREHRLPRRSHSRKIGNQCKNRTACKIGTRCSNTTPIYMEHMTPE